MATIIFNKEFTPEYKERAREILQACDLSLHDTKSSNNKFIGIVTPEMELASVLLYQKIKDIYYLNELATHPDFRKQGHATMLIDALVNDVNQSGKTILFFCDPIRVDFYKKRGAVNMKRKKFRKKIRNVRVPDMCVCMKLEKAESTDLPSKSLELVPMIFCTIIVSTYILMKAFDAVLISVITNHVDFYIDAVKIQNECQEELQLIDAIKIQSVNVDRILVENDIIVDVTFSLDALVANNIKGKSQVVSNLDEYNVQTDAITVKPSPTVSPSFSALEADLSRFFGLGIEDVTIEAVYSVPGSFVQNDIPEEITTDNIETSQASIAA